MRPLSLKSLAPDESSFLYFLFFFSLFPSLISLEVFYEAVVQGQGTGKRVLWWHNDNKKLNLSLSLLQIQLKTCSCEVFYYTYNLCIVTIFFSFLFYFYNERRLFIETTGQYVWFGLVWFVWLCLSYKFVVYFWWWWRLWLKSTKQHKQ